jgi:hypothetical protein
MIVVVEKELELESQGMRRTRRFIGDAAVGDPRWYQTRLNRVVEIEGHPLEQDEPCREPLRSRLARWFHLPLAQREATRSGC